MAAYGLNVFLGFSQLPIWTARLFHNSGLPPYLIVVGMLVLYLFLGCVMDSLAMILITSRSSGRSRL